MCQRTENPKGHQEIFCPQPSHHSTELLKKAARDTENLQIKSECLYVFIAMSVQVQCVQ